MYPIVSSVAVVLFLGWVLIISGVVQGISLIGAQHVPHFWLQLISVVLSVIVGALFIRQPGEGLLAITLLLIVFFMVEGISKLDQRFRSSNHIRPPCRAYRPRCERRARD